MSMYDGVGFLAAGLVFAAFGMKEMAALRIVAMFEPDEYRTKFIWWSGHVE